MPGVSQRSYPMGNIGSSDLRLNKDEGTVPKEAPRKVGGDSSHNDRHSFVAPRAGNVVHKSLHQMSYAEESYVYAGENFYLLPPLKANNLMSMYVKHGSMVDARAVFDNMPKRDVVSWNIMIIGYAKQAEGALALELYAWMQGEGVRPSARTFVGALKACISLEGLEGGRQFDTRCAVTGCLEKGRAIHSQIVKNGLESNVFLGTTLLDMYAKGDNMEDARHVFDKLPHINVVSWNAMILGYSKHEQGGVALELYAQMQQKDVTPNQRTFVGALNACSSLTGVEKETEIDGESVKKECLKRGRSIHAQVVHRGLEGNVFVGNTLVDMYCKCGSMKDARCVFNKWPYHDVISWTAMILGYSKQEEGELALRFYGQMRQEGVEPDHRTFIGALNACSSLAAQKARKQMDEKFFKIGCLEKVRAIHSQVIKSGCELFAFVRDTLSRLYSKYGSMVDAQTVFDGLSSCDNVAAWTNMISGYAEQEKTEEAFRLYAQMQEQGLSADSLAFVALLKACGNAALLETGEELHYEISRVGLETLTIVANSLIGMYAKCGSMIDAQQLFDELATRDVVTWSTLIAGYSRHGESELVFHWFKLMRQEGIQPDGVTFLSVLTACCHLGLVDKGDEYFQIMCKQYGIIPTLEHYNCMVDLFGRAGQVDKALVMVEKMPFQPDFTVWTTVSDAFQKWKNVCIGRNAFENAMR